MPLYDVPAIDTATMKNSAARTETWSHDSQFTFHIFTYVQSLAAMVSRNTTHNKDNGSVTEVGAVITGIVPLGLNLLLGWSADTLDTPAVSSTQPRISQTPMSFPLAYTSAPCL